MNQRLLQIGCSSLLLVVIGLSTVAQAGTELSCSYRATWKGTDKQKGSFSWKGFWFQGDGGWIFRANGDDKAGKSKIEGACGDGNCDFRQTYVSGKLKGQHYYYQAKYTGELPVGPKDLRLKGGWTKNQDKPNADGTWEAFPACKPSKVEGDDIPKALGWKGWDDNE